MRFAFAAAGAATLCISTPSQGAITVVDFEGGSMSTDGKTYFDNGIEFRAIGTFDFFGPGGPHVDHEPYRNTGYWITAGARDFSFLSFDAVCCEPDESDGMSGRGGISAFDRNGIRLFSVGFFGSPDHTVRLTNWDNIAYLRYSGDHVTIDNLVFNVIPEPATWAMMILGFGVLGAAVRRTRQPAVS